MADISKIVLPDTTEYNVKDAGAARQNEAICLARAHNGDGILDGCEMEITGTTLEISSGSVLAGGKVAYFPTGENVSLGGISITDGYVQVILNIQLSHSPQVWITLEESPTTTFDPLTQNDLNIAGNLYQYELCKVEVVSGALSLYSTAPMSSLLSQGKLIVADDVYFNAETGENRLVCFNYDGDLGANIQYSSGGNFSFANRDSLGAAQNGFIANGSGTIVIWSNGNTISIRPNGMGSSTTGRTTFNADGTVDHSNTVDGSLSPTVSGHTVSLNVYRAGNIVYGHFGMSANSNLITISSGQAFGTLGAGFHPRSFSWHFPATGRSADAWASATYYTDMMLSITSSGAVSLVGNTTNIKKCKHIISDFAFPAAT